VKLFYRRCDERTRRVARMKRLLTRATARVSASELLLEMSAPTSDPPQPATGLDQLEQIKKFTKVVADTANFTSIREFKPQDATTNPSLIYSAAQKLEYRHLVEEVLAEQKNSGLSGAAEIEDIIDHLLPRKLLPASSMNSLV
jgi:transaldolase/fructose-6-phosphate aldolase-like protein